VLGAYCFNTQGLKVEGCNNLARVSSNNGIDALARHQLPHLVCLPAQWSLYVCQQRLCLWHMSMTHVYDTCLWHMSMTQRTAGKQARWRGWHRTQCWWLGLRGWFRARCAFATHYNVLQRMAMHCNTRAQLHLWHDSFTSVTWRIYIMWHIRTRASADHGTRAQAYLCYD